MWWLVACRPVVPDPPVVVPVATGETAALPPTPTGHTGATVAHTGRPPPPDLATALAARCPDPTPWEPLFPGLDLHRMTLPQGPACNDGSAPTVYVRAATDPAHAADWVLMAQGGSHCADHEDCAARWCGEGTYDAAHMSTAWDRATRAGTGIQARTPANPFAGWNQAFLRYCSSDQWVGRADAVFEEEPAYAIPFRGHDILLADLDALLGGVRSDDGDEALPPLSAASTVVWSGTSSGAWGMAQHAALARERLPDARVLVVLDAIGSPAPEVLDAAQADAIAQDVRQRWDDVAVWDPWVDERCLGDHAADPWRCSDTEVLLRAYVADDLVLHADLRDPVALSHTAWLGDTDAYAAAMEGTLRLHAALRPSASYHGSACADHGVLDANRLFRTLTVVDGVASGAALSLQDEVLTGLAGGRSLAIDIPS
ncbi:MAG: hypothetical protein H6735_33220, partial [Alphaproteobacteria bacterium]|nr:hypothetical protein [Alphaproteobacteria bacterium]